MANLSDIEEAAAGEDEESKHVLSPSVNSTYTGGNSSRSSNQATIALCVDPSVLAMVSRVRDDEEEDDDDDSRKRKAQLFCFVCCDLVQACVVMNAIYIGLAVFHLVISFMDSEWFDERIKLYQELDDDGGGFSDEIDPWGVVLYTKDFLLIFFSVAGMVGAVKFNKWLVLSSAIMHCFSIILSLVDVEWIFVLSTVPFAYANFHLFLALRKANITRENYATEKHCCCGNRSEDDYDYD